MQGHFLFIVLLALFAGSAAGASAAYASLCDSVFCRILQDSLEEVSLLKGTVDEGACIPQFGEKADAICNTAFDRFATEAPVPDDRKENEELYDKKIEELEKLLDSPLHVLYLKQLSLLREKAMKNFKQALNSGSAGTEFEAMTQADEFFRREAEEATRQSPEWSYSNEVVALKGALQEIASKNKKIQEVENKAARQTQNAMQYLQMQQQQLQAIQQQVSGQSSPWNVGLAYRLPDTNLNLAASYQQGRANVQVSCVPEEAQSLLGANGFVNGVTPGNIGVSFNINI